VIRERLKKLIDGFGQKKAFARGMTCKKTGEIRTEISTKITRWIGLPGPYPPI
jgi:hypothetical protein